MIQKYDSSLINQLVDVKEDFVVSRFSVEDQILQSRIEKYLMRIVIVIMYGGNLRQPRERTLQRE